MQALTEVFTLDEIARAAGVPRLTVQNLVDSGQLLPIEGTAFFAGSDAIRAGRQARGTGHSPAVSFFIPGMLQEERGLSALASSLVHAVFLSALVWSTTGTAEPASVPIRPQARLVFLAGPGPGGGGGGGGSAPRADVRRVARPRPLPSESAAPDPKPLPSRILAAPIAIRAGQDTPEAPDEDGSGPGAGPGLEDGTGGGTGGGPFRPGSGIEPPRLLREVKADYTDEARRRGVTGGVVLEVVITRDGTVGDVKVLRGLGFGLDEGAIAAVRHWRFAPARRRGEPVDVLVEVEVEFDLR